MVWVDASIKVLFHLCSCISPVFPLSCSQIIKNITYIYPKTFKSFKKEGKFTQSGLYWWKRNPKPNSAYDLHKLLDFKAWGSFCDTVTQRTPNLFAQLSALAEEFLFSRMSFPCTRDLAHGFSFFLSPLQPFASAITLSNLTSPSESYCFLSPEITNSVSWLEKKRKYLYFTFPPLTTQAPQWFLKQSTWNV